MLWLWVIGGLLAWLIGAGLVGLMLGYTIRQANAPVPRGGSGPAPRSARARRRSVLLPPVGIALAASAVGLITARYVLRLTGASGAGAQLLLADTPVSAPQLFVGLLFATAAVAAAVGAGRFPRRRVWWLAVALVAGAIAVIQAGAIVDPDVVIARQGAAGHGVALLLGALAAVAVIGVLWIISRNERRDRRRVLGTLALYAGLSVTLSAVAPTAAGNWYVTVTFLQEAGEALAGVFFLMAVLVGVAPRLVLPADWALLRASDAESLEFGQRGLRPAGDPAP